MHTAEAFHLTQTPLALGSSLIEASAGTGKTYAITALVIRLLLEQKLSIREILVVTYTEAATQELRERVRHSLALAWRAFVSGTTDVPFLQELLHTHEHQTAEMGARLQNALCGFDEAPIYTIHGFCQRTLKDRAFESGLLFDTELVTDPSELLREVGDDFWRTQFYDANPVLVQYALKNGLGPDAFVQLLRTCLSYPQLQFLSLAQGRTLASISDELQASFQAARTLWLTRRDEIKACFGSSIKWGNKPYNCDEEMAALYDDLEMCFSRDETAFEALSCLESFCPAALQEARNRRSKNPPPVPTDPFFERCGALCALERLWLASLRLAFVDYARHELPRRKGERKIQFFDDLLTRLDTALCSESGQALAENLRRRYKAALIDEFQDTDPIQYQIFRRAFGEESTFLFMIGDPKQAIYGFRGADIFTYLEAAGEAGRHFTLGENWRSESGLVTAVNELFSAKPRAFVFERIAFQHALPRGKADTAPLLIDGEREPPFQVWFWERGEQKELTKKLAEAIVPGGVATEIVRLLNGDARIGDRKLKPEDIAVLVLENQQAVSIQEALNACRVPNVLYTTASLFASEEASELRRVLAATATPSNESLVRSALATALLDMDGSSLDRLTEAQWQEWLEKFHACLHLWDGRGFFCMFRHWLQREQVRARLLAFPNGERRLTNILHLGEVLHQAESEHRFGINGLLKWLTEQMAAEGEAPEPHQLRLERDENAVRIVTVHKSKGLEYPVVFCPFSWKSSEIKRGLEEQVFFHDPAAGLRLVRDLGPEIDEEHKSLAKEEKLAENVRLLYVALTRAKHRCYFVWGGFKGAGTSAPTWLFHRPDPLNGAVVEALDDHFKTLTDEVMRQDLESIQTRTGGAIALSDLPKAASTLYQPPVESAVRLQAREFVGGIRRDWMVSSFTYLSAGKREETPDRDGVEAAAQVAKPGFGIFAFPRGAKAGTCLHEILERLDFEADAPSIARLVQSRLQASHLDQPGASAAVGQMVHQLLRFPLESGHPNFHLARIPASERLTELEFYFPVRNLVPTVLRALLGRFGWAGEPSQIGRVTFDPINGYLKGFIDLVFRFEGRYYLVDWKSNWLGNTVEDYNQAVLRAEMQQQQYYLQYHLYTVALHKYLSLRLPGYDYTHQFGGVIYLFLRGLDPTKPEHGAFRDRPSWEAIEQLSNLLTPP